MKKYIYDGTVNQQRDVICYAFSPDLIDASEEDLGAFLKVLSLNFPKTDNGKDDNGEKVYRPMDNIESLNTFNSAYINVVRLIELRKAKKRHSHILWVSIGTLIILALTLFISILVSFCKVV